MSRNFWLGRELTKKVGPITVMDFEKCNSILMTEMDKMGIQLRDPTQSIGTLSGGERQTVAIARAVFFGAKILIISGKPWVAASQVWSQMKQVCWD